MRKLCILNAAIILAAGFILCGAAAESNWLSQVPEKDRARANPMAGDNDAAAAGAKLFRQHCAACHGITAEGKSKHPSLHSDKVRNAAPGELQWLLTNGSLRRGMPSWSRLPEAQRWQVVTYLQTLK